MAVSIAGRTLPLPILQGGMGVGISLDRLAGAVAACGGMGTISTAACGYREPDYEKDPNAANLRLNKTDFTLYAKDPDVQMKVSGTDSPVTWASGNTAVVTVSETGVVKWVGKGNTTVTATVDGVTLECIVRAK